MHIFEMEGVLMLSCSFRYSGKVCDFFEEEFIALETLISETVSNQLLISKSGEQDWDRKDLQQCQSRIPVQGCYGKHW